MALWALRLGEVEPQDDRPRTGALDIPVDSPIFLEASHVNEVFQGAKGHAFHQSKNLVTSAGGACPDAIADLSFLVRGAANLQFDSPLLSIEGSTTAFNAVQGGIAIRQAVERLKRAAEIGDSWGKQEAAIDLLRGLMQTSGGVLLAGFRPLSIACDLSNTVQAVDATSKLGLASYWSGAIGNGVFGAMYGLISLWCGWNMWKYRCFQSNLHKDKDPQNLSSVANLQKYLHFFQKEVGTISGKQTLGDMQSKYKNRYGSSSEERLKLKFQTRAHLSTRLWIKNFLKEMASELGGVSFSKKECEGLATRVLQEADTLLQGQKEEILQSLGFQGEDLHKSSFISSLSMTEVLGLEVSTIRKNAQAQSRMAKATSGDCVHAVKLALTARLPERLASSDEVVREQALSEAKSLVEKVEKELYSNKQWNAILCIAAVVGLVATVFAFVLTGGVAPLVVGALFILSSLLMQYIDLWVFLKPGLTSSSAPGKYDKTVVSVNAALGALSLVAVIVLASVFSLGTAPLITALIIGVCWLITSGATLYYLDKKEKRFHRENPSLQSLKEELFSKEGVCTRIGKTLFPFAFHSIEKKESDKLDEEVISLFKKLPKADRRAIKMRLAARALSPISAERTLQTEEDRQLDGDGLHPRDDGNHRFGERFFYKDPFDPLVKKAVHKALQKQPASIALRGLSLRLDQQNGNASEVVSYFNEQLSYAEKEIVRKEIYFCRAKTLVGRVYQEKKEGMTRKDLAELIEQRMQEVKQRTLDFRDSLCRSHQVAMLPRLI